MALRNSNLLDSQNIVYGNRTYPVLPGGLIVGLPADVESDLLAVGGYTHVDEPGSGYQSAEPRQFFDTPEAPRPAQTPAEIRAAVQAAVEAERPKNYIDAQTFARNKLLELCGGEEPNWLSAGERAGLGLPLVIEKEVEKAAPAVVAPDVPDAESIPAVHVSEAETQGQDAMKKPGRPKKDV